MTETQPGGDERTSSDKTSRFNRLPEASVLACSEFVAGYLTLVGDIIESSAKIGQSLVDIAEPIGKTFDNFGQSIKKAAERFDQELSKDTS